MNGNDLIAQLESGRISPESFHHADHIRLAFEYLSRYSNLEAMSRFCLALKNFAQAHGKTNLYHETITYAYFFAIRERMARAGGSQPWDEFSAQNLDLLVWKGGILENMYRPETLKSELARTTFLLPDRVR